LNYLQLYAPSISTIGTLGAGIALYGPTIGASLVTRYQQIGPNTYTLEEVVTSNKKAKQLFSGKSAPLIQLHSVHDFEIENSRFTDERYFAAIFSENVSS
jgi:hypothetical protein